MQLVVGQLSEVCFFISLGCLPGDLERMRPSALVHDTFKNKVDHDNPQNRHESAWVLAREFAGRHIRDPALLEVIELHVEAFNAWAAGERSGNWSKAKERAHRLIERLGPNLPLYLRFYLLADNLTG